jgi:NAD(P)-dependent dehydrogenase (short-subunit alcohol dehydrogenase family)
MTKRLQDRIALVVGAGSIGPGLGNGKAAAILYAREGAKVFAVDINADAVEETRQLIADEGNTCVAHTADATDAAAVQGMVEACTAAFARIDILHNNLGITEIGGPVDLPEERWDRLMDVNVKSMFLACKYVLPIMEAQGAGVVTNISSISAERYAGFPSVVYNTAKGAVKQFTQNVAMEYARKGIRANCVQPGLVDTPLVHTFKDAYPGDWDEVVRHRHAMAPMGRMGTGWDIAKAAVFLASDDAAYITGVSLPVDGGLSGIFTTPTEMPGT